MMTISEILQARDGLTELEARRRARETKDEVEALIELGFGLSEVEDYLRIELGLEPDYLDELL